MSGCFRALGLVCLMFAGSIAPAAAPPPADPAPGTAFLDQVKANFTKWDLDHDGTLSADEIEKAVDDPAVQGPPAAAAAALRRAIRGKSSPGPITLDGLTASVNDRSNVLPKPPAYGIMYVAGLRKIEETHRELFVSGSPQIDTLRQGHLGDCFLIAPLGEIAARRPELLKKIMSEMPNGEIAVKFGSGETVTLPLPTDAEIILGASTLNDGIWANVLEKSIGHVYLERQKTPRHLTPYSIIGVGGTPSSPLSIITGFKCTKISCHDFQGGKLDAATRDARLEEIRRNLVDAFASQRLVVSGTGEIHGPETKVPGLYYDHSYAVLNYDRATDLITFWNPMGNHYVPNGSPGLEHGYATSHGRFDCPLTQAVMWLGAFTFETDQPALE